MLDESLFSLEDSPVRTTAWQASVRDWLATVARSGGSISGSLLSSAPSMFLGKTSRAFSHPITDETSEPLSAASSRSGIAWPGGYMTLSSSEWPSGAVASSSSLLEILVPHADTKYSLSPRACQGILNRAARRGKVLPPRLQEALEKVAARMTEEEREASIRAQEEWHEARDSLPEEEMDDAYMEEWT